MVDTHDKCLDPVCIIDINIQSVHRHFYIKWRVELNQDTILWALQCLCQSWYLSVNTTLN